MAPSPLAVLCGDRAAPALVETAAQLQAGGMRVAVLGSPALAAALVAAKVPHVAVSDAADAARLLADRVEAVLAPMPAAAAPAGESPKQLHARLDPWVAGAFAFVRTAAWHHKQMSVVVDEADLPAVRAKLSRDGSLAFSVREKRQLAEKAFARFAALDAAIAASLAGESGTLSLLVSPLASRQGNSGLMSCAC